MLGIRVLHAYSLSSSIDNQLRSVSSTYYSLTVLRPSVPFTLATRLPDPPIYPSSPQAPGAQLPRRPTPTPAEISPGRPGTHHPHRPERRVATVNPEIFFRGGAPDPGGGPPQGGERGRRKRGKEEGGEGEKKGKRVYRRPRKPAPFLEADSHVHPTYPAFGATGRGTAA